jgi:hypothetical protein
MSSDHPDAPENVRPVADDVPPVEIEANVTQDDKTMAMLCHLLSIFTGFVGPLVIWLVKKDQSKFVDDQGKECLNFNLTMLIGHLIGGATICFTFGVINAALGVIQIVFSILAALEANKGKAYRYPMNIRMIK